jgi:preprotein translocase subunit SecD
MPKLRIGTAAALLAALGLAACGGPNDPVACGPTGGPRVVFRAEPTPDEPRVTSAGIERTIDAMCKRSRELGADGARIVRLRGNRIVVRLGPGADAAQTAVALGIPARLAFYDWDANVIGSPDRPLPDLLHAVRRAAGSAPRGEPSDLPPGGAEEQTAGRLHGDQQRIQAFYDRRNDASGASYFAAAGGRIVAGPETSCGGLGEALAGGHRQARAPIRTGDADAPTCTRRLAGSRLLPAGGQVLVVPRGIRVVAAARPGGGAPPAGPAGALPEGSAGYYVLEDDAALTADAVKSAESIRDQATGVASVRVHFTEDGATAFRSLTASIAQSGLQDPGAGSPRLAIALDDQLVSLAAIDPQASPAGLDPAPGATLGNVGSEAQANLLAKLIGSGALPLDVRQAP